MLIIDDEKEKILEKYYDEFKQYDSIYDLLKRIKENGNLIIANDYITLLKQIGLDKYKYDKLEKKYKKLYIENKKLIENNKKNYKTFLKLKDENKILKEKINEQEIKEQELSKKFFQEITNIYYDLEQKNKENLLSKETLIKKQRQITDKQIEEIKELRKQGLSYSKIEKITQWSKFTISRVVNGFYDKK